MIEFSDNQGRTWVLQVTTIARFTAWTGQTRLFLNDGTELVADVDYSRMRDAVLTVRNQFVSLLTAA